MTTLLTKSDLLKNIRSTATKLDEIELINNQISSFYQEPFNNHMKKVMAIGINIAWIGALFGILNFYIGPLLALYPVLYFVFMGSKVSNRIASFAYKRKLDKYENTIEQLHQRKLDLEYELHTISMIDKELHNPKMLHKFESYLTSKTATTLEGCLELYKKEAV